MATRYFIAIPDPEAARGAGDFAFNAHGADGFARELQEALRGDVFKHRMRLLAGGAWELRDVRAG